jgi:transposase-like protein
MKKKDPNSSVQQGKPVRRKYDEEFKQRALMMVRNGQSVRSVAEALGISENILNQWKRVAVPTNQPPSWKSSNCGNDSSRLKWSATS